LQEVSSIRTRLDRNLVRTLIPFCSKGWEKIKTMAGFGYLEDFFKSISNQNIYLYLLKGKRVYVSPSNLLS
jgi:hypothetical protein